MDKKVSGAIVSSSLPSTTNAGLSVAPLVTTEGLSFFGVSVSDWVYVAVFAFYALSALHVLYKIWVRYRWVKNNLHAPRDGVVQVTQMVNNQEINAQLEKTRMRSSKK